MLFKISWAIVPTLGMSLLFAGVNVGEAKLADSKSLDAQKALKDIQATRNSSFSCMRGMWRKTTGHGTPSAYKMIAKSIKRTFTIKSYYLVGNRATMVVEDYSKFDMINPKTHKTVNFEEIIVEQEIWLKIEDRPLAKVIDVDWQWRQAG